MIKKKQYKGMSDEDLVKAIKNRDDNAFEYFVDSHNKRIFNIALRFLANYDDAAEMTQEIFLKIYQKIHTFKGDCSLKTWIHRVATNHCIDEIRKRKKIVTYSIDKEIDYKDQQFVPEIIDENSGPEELAEIGELQHKVREALSKIPDDYRVILILREFDGMSYVEISDALGIPIGTVKSRINRAKILLRNILEKGNYMGEENVT